jgi:single-strand selective monofunctional uracil DNA glycosylase
VNPISITKKLICAVKPLKFSAPVTHVYNPLEYAWKLHELYLKKFGTGQKEVLFLGMNPGPWGMAQTGIPFGEVNLVRDWIGLNGPVEKPKKEHPKRPVLGFDTTRSEVSGARLWGWAKDTYKTPDRFFKSRLILNFCPLSFMEESGKNVTPDKLPIEERRPLLDACDKALRQLVQYYKPKFVIGVGGFARKRAERVVGDLDLKVAEILHPSPASPMANRGWAPQASAQLKKLRIL